MNAGKSTNLLQSNYNYIERGMSTLLFSPAIDDRFGLGKITSRIGLNANSLSYDNSTDIFTIVKQKKNISDIHCVLVDEAQFLTKKQVLSISDIVDFLNIPVLAYGLRNDFRAEPFEGSKYLLTWADYLIEIKTICHCGKKATHVLRLDKNKQVIKKGEQLKVGGENIYSSVCRKHFKQEEA